jgi:hypothetical protein
MLIVEKEKLLFVIHFEFFCNKHNVKYMKNHKNKG